MTEDEADDGDGGIDAVKEGEFAAHGEPFHLLVVEVAF